MIRRMKARPKQQKKQKIYDEMIIPDDIKHRYYKKLLDLKISENFAQMKRSMYIIKCDKNSSSLEVENR